MLDRLRRRSMAPGKPVLDPDRAWLVVFSVAAVLAGLYAAFRFTFG